MANIIMRGDTEYEDTYWTIAWWLKMYEQAIWMDQYFTGYTELRRWIRNRIIRKYIELDYQIELSHTTESCDEYSR